MTKYPNAQIPKEFRMAKPEMGGMLRREEARRGLFAWRVRDSKPYRASHAHDLEAAKTMQVKRSLLRPRDLAILLL